MLKLLLMACSMSIALAQQPDIAILEERMPNGDESEIVSIDLKKRDGTEDISLTAQLRFHLNQSQVYVNGHPIIHRTVNSVCMRIMIIEIKRGIKMTPRLAPVIFRVLVREKSSDNGNKKLIAEFEFIKVEQYEVIQVDVKQIMWEGSDRQPVTSISFQDSVIHHEPQEKDHHIYIPDPGFKPRLPSHGLKGAEEVYEHKVHDQRYHGRQYHGQHHHRHNQSEVLCWFRRLTVGGKIAVICTVVLTFLGLLLSLIICWKRHFYRKNLNVEAPNDDFTEVEECGGDNDVEKKDTKNITTDDGRFHIEVNACVVDVDDKKALIE